MRLLYTFVAFSLICFLASVGDTAECSSPGTEVLGRWWASAYESAGAASPGSGSTPARESLPGTTSVHPRRRKIQLVPSAEQLLLQLGSGAALRRGQAGRQNLSSSRSAKRATRRHTIQAKADVGAARHVQRQTSAVNSSAEGSPVLVQVAAALHVRLRAAEASTSLYIIVALEALAFLLLVTGLALVFGTWASHDEFTKGHSPASADVMRRAEVQSPTCTTPAQLDVAWVPATSVQSLAPRSAASLTVAGVARAVDLTPSSQLSGIRGYPVGSDICCRLASTTSTRTPRHQTAPQSQNDVASTRGRSKASLANVESTSVPASPRSLNITSQVIGCNANTLPLCPGLVVPNEKVFVFAVREVLGRERQELSFSVVDLLDTPLCHVIVSEKKGGPCSISLQFIDGKPVARINTDALHVACPGHPKICRPSGALFGSLSQLGGAASGYVLRDAADEPLLTVAGDFRGRKVNVVAASGALMCSTRRCMSLANSIPDASYYEVHVASSVDAAVVLCTLLAVDKMHGARK